MTSTVDAVDLKIAAPREARGTRHDVRYTVSVLHVCEAEGYSVSCWVGVCHWDTETLTL